jgi:sugar/nucleoside kinase (ribokinase family)
VQHLLVDSQALQRIVLTMGVHGVCVMERATSSHTDARTHAGVVYASISAPTVERVVSVSGAGDW